MTAAPTYPPPLVAATINSSTPVQLGGPGTHGNLAEFRGERPGIGLELGCLDRQDSGHRPLDWLFGILIMSQDREILDEELNCGSTKAIVSPKRARSIDKLAC